MEGQASDHRGAALMLPTWPPAKELIADRGYDTACFRAELAQRDIAACIPSTRSRKQPIPHDVTLYRRRHRIETMVARLKDWRRIAMRFDRCAYTFFAAITLAAIVTFWLNQRDMSLGPRRRLDSGASPCHPRRAGATGAAKA
jgi:transposase